MRKPLFTGCCTALVTPFENGKVNFTMLETLLARQINAGIKAVVICGTTGESPTLSDTEKLAMFRHAKAYAGNNCTIIAGTGSNCTEHAVSLSQAAEETGIDGLRKTPLLSLLLLTSSCTLTKLLRATPSWRPVQTGASMS